MSVNFIPLTPEEDDFLLDVDMTLTIKQESLEPQDYNRLCILYTCLKNLLSRLEEPSMLVIDDYIYVCDMIDKHKELSQCQT